MRALHLFVAASILATPSPALAQHRDSDHRHRPPAPREAAVDFGIFPPVQPPPPPVTVPPTPPAPAVPMGPLPCLQGPSAAIGGPTDPCSYKLHVLLPDEVAIREEGEVTYQFHGGGHAIAIYKVSRNTSRNDIGRFLCQGQDPADIVDPNAHPCNGAAAAGIANAALARLIPDDRGRIVIEVGPGGAAHPANRVWSPEDRLMSAGGIQFLNGGTIPAGTTSNGQLITYRFLEEGRYLVICMNRSHFLNDWMFGFVNVVER